MSPQNRLRLFATSAGAILALATWGAAPWRPWFFVLFLGLEFVVELTVRLRSREAEQMIHVAVLSLATTLGVRWLHPEAHALTTTGAFLHVLGLLVCAIGLGSMLANYIRPRELRTI